MTKNEELKHARKNLINKMAEVPRTIVYVDTDEDATAEFRDFFTLHQYNVKTFCDPLEAFYWMKKNTVDLIVSEVSLPILSGISLLRKLRLHEKMSDIPFIMVTNNVVKFIPDVKKVKANDLYPKPLDLEKMLTRVKYLSRIKVEQDESFKMLQNTWSRRIYPGHLKRFTSLLSGVVLFLTSLPFLLIIYGVLSFKTKNPIVVEDKIGAGYDLISFYHFNTTLGDKFSSFLKKYNLYRWPELLNVIFGDITMVGNKALTLSEAKQYTSDKNSVRFLAPTGLTGLRHVYDVKLKKSIYVACELENNYAMTRNIFQDVKILFKNLPYFFKQSNSTYYDL